MSKNYLTEAFKELDLLESQSFDVDKKGTSELEDFLEDDSLDDFEVVIDPEAETEEDLQKSYMGKVILMCDVCRSMIYKDPAEIVVDEESQLANVGELCPYCFTGDGYKIVGKVAPYEEVTVEAEKPVEVKVDGKEVEVEDKIEEEIQQDQKFPVEHKKAPVMEDLDLDAIEFDNPGQAVEVGLDATEELLYNPEEVDKFVEHMKSKYNLEGSEITYLEDFVATTLEGDNFHTEAKKYYRGKLPIRYARDLTDADKAYVKNMLNKCKTESDFEDLLYKAINNLSLELDESLKRRYKKFSLKENKNKKLKESTSKEKTIKEDLDFTDEAEIRKQLAKYSGQYLTITFKGSENWKHISDLLEEYNDGDEEEAESALDELESSYRKEYDLLKSLEVDEISEITVMGRDVIVTIKVNKDNLIHNFSDNYSDLINMPSIYKDTIKILELELNESLIKNNKKLKESMDDISITTEDQVIKIKSTPREDKETIQPVTETEVEEAKEVEEDIPTEEVKTQEEEVVEEPEEIDVDLDEIDEEGMDDLGESYLKSVYENVNGFKTSKAVLQGNKMILEGVISFTSGNKAKTKFIFESKEATKRGKLKFLGENKNISKNKKAFTLIGSLNNKKLMLESLNYNYTGKDSKTGKTKRLYGTIRRKLK